VVNSVLEKTRSAVGRAGTRGDRRRKRKGGRQASDGRRAHGKGQLLRTRGELVTGGQNFNETRLKESFSTKEIVNVQQGNSSCVSSC
jgi:hypothetical protein